MNPKGILIKSSWKNNKSSSNVSPDLTSVIFFKEINSYINPLTSNVPYHIETSQLIYNGNQLTGFFIMGNIVR